LIRRRRSTLPMLKTCASGCPRPAPPTPARKACCGGLARLCGREDVESYGALDVQAPAATLRRWLTQHNASPLFMTVDALLNARDAEDAERARLEAERQAAVAEARRQAEALDVERQAQAALRCRREQMGARYRHRSLGAGHIFCLVALAPPCASHACRRGGRSAKGLLGDSPTCWALTSLISALCAVGA
jgi:hypothetical protein